MTYPTYAEIKAAFDGITADGEEADVTLNICGLVIGDPNLRDTLHLTTALMEGLIAKAPGPDRTKALLDRTAFVASCLAKGLNLGLRIGEARQAGVKSRQSIENLLAHYKNGECHGNEALSANEQCIKTLEWVLGIK